MKTNTDAVLSAKSLRYFLQLIDNMSYTQASVKYNYLPIWPNNGDPTARSSFLICCVKAG